ncbi:PEP-CTERM sorting domain-containing protein [Oscillatoriales cyanobacterium LEGE 11467]|uniref:PEP-CTERM sorting domain-containing protein n=1 Tax=Zarconia navalis LEGE 11467 TaxID=1828826 RepID=A0A928Z966_9CYAN|nr:XDD3 family exosortase-dependent surface protein [Zarconia navalis]MBE9041364.1 PEP-CTERM sorting domain-containing protein [Zarconia navalis LEGE 11467]
MKTLTLNNIIKVAAASICISAISGQAANAGQMYNGVNYAIDSFADGSDVGVRGANSSYEFYGMAIKEAGDKVYIGINSNLALDGESYHRAADKNIGYGDLFFNFSGDNLKTANDSGNLFGIRFAGTNDSGVSETGVFSNVVGQNVAKENAGFRHLKHYDNWAKSDSSMADLDTTDEYFQDYYRQKHSVTNSIASGTKIGDIAMLDADALSGLGFDFGHFNATGTHTFGFSFDRALLPGADYIAHLFAECINDGMAIAGNLPAVSPVSASVPEPASIMGLAAIGIIGASGKLRKRKQADS